MKRLPTPLPTIVRLPLAMVLALMIGLLVHRLTRVPLHPPAAAGANQIHSQNRPDIASLSDDELGQLARDALSALSQRGHSHEGNAVASDQIELSSQSPDAQRAQLGIENARRLLPLAKELTLLWLNEHVTLKQERRMIGAVHRIALDWQLGASAEVRERNLTQIRIGANYATLLKSDDEAIFLLGHELTHVAARADRLEKFINDTTETVRSSTSIQLNDVQKEELTCDFVGAEILKRFVMLHPTNEPDTARLSRTVGYQPPAERLQRAWADFCGSYNGEVGDHEHLSDDQTIRSLVVLDPELKALIPIDASSTGLCQ